MGCLPVTSKCCFCAPLRPGLLAWAYIKLVVAVASLVCIASVTLSIYHSDRFITFFALVCLSVVTVVFSVVFVVGLHLENYKIILVFYWFSMLEVLMTLGMLAWEIYEVTGYTYWPRHYWTFTLIQFTSRIVIGTLLPIYFIIVIRSELLAIKGGGEQSAMTADDETRVVLDPLVANEQDKRYNFVYSRTEFEPKFNNTGPLFPVEELRIEKLKQNLGK